MILADEPTGALDTRTSDDVMRLLSTLNKVGITIVLVTHEPDVAEWARRRIGFRDGHLESDLRQPGRDAPEPAAP
jgi:putative ABC transport system ATP-binding protein